MRIWPWVLLIVLLLFRLYIHYGFRKYSEGDGIKVKGTVYTETNQYDSAQSITIEDLIVYLPPYPSVDYGDSVTVEGIVTEGKIKRAKLVELKKSQNVFIGLRNKIIDFYKKSLPLNESALVSGMVLGSGDSISKEFWGELTKTGTAHVVVASGTNVAMVGGFILIILTSLVARKKALLLATGAVWVYVIFSGFNAPIVRAAILGSLVFVAQLTGKKAHTTRLLFFAGLIMLLVKPYWIKDIGFLLSFAATLSLTLFGSKVYRLIHNVSKLRRVPEIIKADFASTLSAQIGVMPILLLSFGQFNLFSPLINVLILWTIPFITIAGMAAGVVGLISEPVGRTLMLLVYPLTKWFVSVIAICAKLF